MLSASQWGGNSTDCLPVSKDIQEIRTLLTNYQHALNAGSTDQAVALYTQDGVVMPQHSASHIGIDAVRQAYDGFFSMIKFDVVFDIKEVVPTAPEWAFARTESQGTTDMKGRGIGHEANQELFVLQKVKGKGGEPEWKIARYCFSTTNPPPK